MEYEKSIEESTNNVVISGVVVDDITFSHEIENEKFFEFKLEVERLSGSKDYIPVTVSERTVFGMNIKKNDFVMVTGQYRSFNKQADQKSKLVLFVFAKEISLEKSRKYVNDVKLTGYLCKTPIYRKTPFGREICDVLLAVNRNNYHKSDYVPCILWGRNARYIAGQSVGCKLEVTGRIQSRTYTKTNQDGSLEEKVAYEISCQKINVVSNVSPINFDYSEQPSDEIV